MTPQPVPQNRQGAFDHFSDRVSTPPGIGWAAADAGMPAAAAAIAAAWLFSMSRRVNDISGLPFVCSISVDGLEHEVRRQDAVHQRDSGQAAADRILIRAF